MRYFEIELENVLVVQVATSAEKDDPMTDYAVLVFLKIKWKYTSADD